MVCCFASHARKAAADSKKVGLIGGPLSAQLKVRATADVRPVCDNVRVGLVGHSIVVRGEVQSAGDLVIEGRVDGPVWVDGQSVTVALSATVTGDILARHIVVLGHVTGTMVASELVDIRASGCVAGRVLATGFALSDGATFDGSVEPQHLEAALSVARHRRAEQSQQGRK